ncbi:MAG: hypothetical protein ACPGID_06980 [Rubricella sp.]
MTDDTPEDWTDEERRQLTALTLHKLFTEEGVEEGVEVTVVYDLVPGKAPRQDDLNRALAMFGYRAQQGEEGGLVVAVEGVALTLDQVWLHEERIMTIARARGYEPDGWGFWAP